MAIPRTESETSYMRKHRVKCHWKRDEDDRLTLLVKTLGPEKWDRIASYIPGRTGKSCRIRWLNQLDPRVNKAPFSAQENQKLIQLHREYGNRWSTIARYFPSRTDNHVKNQYHVLTGKRCVRSFPLSLGEGSVGLSRYQSISMAPVDSQFTEMWPPSVNGQAENLTRIGSPILRRLGIDSSDCVSGHPHQMLSLGNSLVSNSSSAAVEELYSVPQPQQGVGIKKYQFFDFLGVENSETD